MSSVVVSIPNADDLNLQERSSKKKFFQFSVVSLLKQSEKHDMRTITHSIKVGMALVLVSFLYILDPLYEQVGNNAMWAIMTVVVVLEPFTGATLSKGLFRGLGTVIGGGLGCLTAVCAHEAGEKGKAILVGCSVFLFGATATYFRQRPTIKKRYDYGFMIFILTFNLVAVSGLRGETVIEIARDRLATIFIGFAICIFTSFCVFPTWSSNELHNSIALKFGTLASSVEGVLEEYFIPLDKGRQRVDNFSSCKAVLNSKLQDESLVNLARWEPWHGKFGLFHPWEKYLQIGEGLRELATSTFALRGSLQSSRQPSPDVRERIKEPCETLGSLLAWTLRELGESIMEMRRCKPEASIASKLQHAKLELSSAASPSAMRELHDDNEHGLAVAHFVFQLGEMAGKVEELARQVEDLGEAAGF